MAAMPPMIVPIVALGNAILWIICNTVEVDPKDIDWYLVVAAAVAALCALGQLLLHAFFWWLPPPPPPAGTGILEPLVARSSENDEERPDLPPSTGQSESESDDDERRVGSGTGASNQSTATGATAATTTTGASTSAGTTPSTTMGAQTPTRSSLIAQGTDATGKCDVHSDADGIDTKTASEGSADRGQIHADQPSDRRAQLRDYIVHVGESSDSDGELAAANLPPIHPQQQQHHQPDIGKDLPGNAAV